MSPAEVMGMAQELGVRLWADPNGDFVEFEPPSRVTRELHQAIVANKTGLLALLPQPAPKVLPVAPRAPPAPLNGHAKTPSFTPQPEIVQDEEVEQPMRRRHREKDWFAVPDRVRFVLLHKDTGLSDAELRVYLFLVGQTMGWGEETDDISLKQIREGITRKDGVVRSTGTGLSARAIITALTTLKDFGLITIQTNRDDKRGKVANTYALVRKEGDSRDPLVKPTSHAHMKPTS